MSLFYQKNIRFIILFLMCAIYFFSYLQRVGIPGTLFDQLQIDFAASAAAVSLLSAIFLFIYGGAQFFVGLIADKFNGARTLLAGGALLSVGSIFFPLVHSMPALYAARAIVALGSSLIFISIVKSVDEMYEPSRFAVVLGVVGFLGYSGGMAGTYPLDRLAAFFGWRLALLFIGLLCTMTIGVAMIVFKRAGYLRNPVEIKTKSAFRSVVRNIRALPIMASHSINFSVYFVFQAAIGKKMLMDCCGLNHAEAAKTTFLMMLALMIVTFSCGFISRGIGNRRKPLLIGSSMFVMCGSLIVSLVLIFHANPLWLSVGMIIISLAAGCTSLFMTTMKESSPPGSTGTAVGILNGIAYLLVAVVTHVAGLVMDMFTDTAVRVETAVVYPRQAYIFITAGCFFFGVCSLFSSFFIRESRGVSI